MSNETYLNHPTFGLLYRICLLDDNQELFTTLYAQRIFFLVKMNSNEQTFEPITRADARMMVESRLRNFRRNGQAQDYQQLQAIHQKTFQ